MSLVLFTFKKVLALGCIPICLIFLAASVSRLTDVLRTVVFLMIAILCLLLAAWLWKSDV
ncbi:MAG TPA: hypothetical protein VMC42_00225 [Methanoregulaceae archaeon]|nr:hypothetical protein [Methanoregulaceae archaeon]